MRVVSYLPRLRQRHVRYLDRVLAELMGSNPSSKRDADALVARSVIGTVNSYDRFCRYLYVSTAMGAKDASGAIAVPSTYRQPNEAAAVRHAFFALNPRRVASGRRQEPDWKVPAELLKAMAAVQALNYQQVSNALAVQTRALGMLPVFRNFYAHRGQETARRALNQGREIAIVGQHPTDILLATPRVDALLVEWVFDVQTVVDLMA